MTGFDAVITSRSLAINTDITGKDTPDSIDPADVGNNMIADLAALQPFMDSINAFVIGNGTSAPNDADGAENDVYFQTNGGSSLIVWRKTTFNWAVQSTIPLGVTYQDGIISGLRTQLYLDDAYVYVTQGSWAISNAVYGKATPTIINYNPATVGSDRIDTIYATTTNSILYLAGSPSGSPVKPTLPANTLEVDSIYVPAEGTGNPYMFSSGEGVDLSDYATVNYVDGLDADNVKLSPTVQQTGDINISGEARVGTLKVNGNSEFDSSGLIRYQRSDFYGKLLTLDGSGYLSGLPNTLTVQENSGIFSNIQPLIDASLNGQTIRLKPNTVYTQTDPLYLKQGVTLDLNGATLKRANQVTATTTANVSIGATVINVNSVPSDWQIGDMLQLYSNNTFTTSSYKEELVILSKTGTSVTLKNAITKNASGATTYTWNTGVTVRKIFSQLTSVKLGEDDLFTTATDWTVKNGTIDGNQSNNGGNFYWGVNMAVKNNGHATINGVTFKDMPNECVFGSGFTLYNNKATNLNGSFLHMSGYLSGGEAIFGGEIFGNQTYDTNKKNSTSTTGHSEGVITFSFSSGRSNIHDNRFVKGGLSALGNISGASNVLDGANQELIIHDNYFEEFNQIVNRWDYLLADLRDVDNINIHDNIFANCGSNDWFSYISNINSAGAIQFFNNVLSDGTTLINVPSKVLVDLDKVLSNGNISNKPITVGSRVDIVDTANDNTIVFQASDAVANISVLKNDFSGVKTLAIARYGGRVYIGNNTGVSGSTADTQVNGSASASANNGEDKTLVRNIDIPSGTYTPTMTITNGAANVTASTVNTHRYHRVGNMVMVSGTIAFTTNANITNLRFRLSLPIASTLGTYDIDGHGEVDSSFSTYAPHVIVYRGTTSLAEVQLQTITGGFGVYYSFTYTVI